MTLRFPRRAPSLTGWRDLIIFALGAVGALEHFVLNDGPLDPIRAAAICALLGLPFLLRPGEESPPPSPDPSALPTPSDGALPGGQDGNP